MHIVRCSEHYTTVFLNTAAWTTYAYTVAQPRFECHAVRFMQFYYMRVYVHIFRIKIRLCSHISHTVVCNMQCPPPWSMLFLLLIYLSCTIYVLFMSNIVFFSERKLIFFSCEKVKANTMTYICAYSSY